MNNDLISRKALLDEIGGLQVTLCGRDIFTRPARNSALRVINEQPAVDPYKHGRNETQMNPVDEFICSECGFTVQDFEGYDSEEEVYYGFNPHYCPNCGAKMDGGKEAHTNGD